MPSQTSRRAFLALLGASAAAGRVAAQPSPALTPEAFGAKGDGRTNDTDAFAALSDSVNRRGGGTVVLRPVTYLVGGPAHRGNSAESSLTGRFGFPPARVLRFENCSGPVIVRGNGARLKAAPGLRFGSFHPRTGQPIEPSLPFYDRASRAAPYIAMIEAQRCTGLVEITDIELDGNIGELRIGGKWGNSGWQVPGSGLRLIENRGPEHIARVHSHDHPLDGVTITGESDRNQSSLLSGLLCDRNGRQGCSITGGRNYRFDRCRFIRTGRGRIASSPRSGVDIEAEGRRVIRNLSFSGCEFSDNSGPGLVADSGDTSDVRFDKCTFVGTTNWSAWPRKPFMRFDDCLFVGALVHAFASANPEQAAQFANCRFRDDPRLSPTGRIYGGVNPAAPRSAELPNNPNVLFDRCDFTLTGELLLPLTSGVIYRDCRMSQASPRRSRPNGTYLGTSIINGNADISGSVIRGEVILNGRTVRRG